MGGYIESAELAYDGGGSMPDWMADEAEQQLDQRAEEIIKDELGLRELDAWNECGVRLWQHIARIMRNLDKACLGDQISIDAVLTACNNMQRDLLKDARDWEESK